MSIFDALLNTAAIGLGRSGQKAAAEKCYNVWKRVAKSKKSWKDLTISEQETWMIAVWDELSQ